MVVRINLTKRQIRALESVLREEYHAKPKSKIERLIEVKLLQIVAEDAKRMLKLAERILDSKS